MLSLLTEKAWCTCTFLNHFREANEQLLCALFQYNRLCCYFFLYKTSLGISCVMYYSECEQNFSTNSVWTYTILTLWVVRNFCGGVYFRRWFSLKRCNSHSKWPAVCAFVFSQILLARRLIRQLFLSCCKLL